MNNFNKIFLGIYIVLCLPYLAFSKVTLMAPDSFYKGEQVVFKLTVSGGDVQFPDITDIDGVAVQSIGTSSSTTIINGRRSQNITKTFAIRPNKDITIPSFKIEIDGNMENSVEKKLIMKLVQKTVSSQYDITIKVNKKDIYVGEDIVFTLTFKYKKNTKIVDLNFIKPVFENFWAKELASTNNQTTQGEYIVQELNYLLFPQKAGELNIEPIRIDIFTSSNRVQQYNFFRTTSTKTTSVYSNSLVLQVKPLPQNVKLIGDFEIISTIDKNNIGQGDAVSYKLTINGRGNVDDIEEINLNIPNATIYDNPSKKEFDIQNGLYGGIFTKTYSIVGQDNFIIPSISFQYFDKKTLTVKTIKTKSYDIEVKGVVKKETKLETLESKEIKTIKKEKIITKVIETSDNQKFIFFVLGMVLSVVLFFIYFILKNRLQVKEDKPLLKQIKSSKSSSELLKVLIAYINIDKQLDTIIYSLEMNNNDLDFKKIKKDILEIVKDKQLEIKF